MISRVIQEVCTLPNVGDSERKALAFVNSRFQTFDNLNDLESLVCSAQQHNGKFQSKFSLSSSQINAALENAKTATEQHLHTAQELSLLRHSLADELLELSRELVSSLPGHESKPTLLEDVEMFQRDLKELESIKGYVQIIQHALQLSERVTKLLHESEFSITASSLTEYRTLQDFVEKVTAACLSVETTFNGPLNLVQFLQETCRRNWGLFRNTLSGHLNKSAEKIGWPASITYISVPSEDRATFEFAFRNLLKLQTWGGKNRAPSLPLQQSSKDGLYPLQALVQPISLRFKYHFEGNRQTNRLDKPEWYLSHILNAANDHRIFMETVVQRLLDMPEYRNVKAWHEFVRLLLPLLTRKLKQTAPSLLLHPSLLAHTINQAIIFDAALVEEGFNIQETSLASETWEGVSSVILGNTQWFESWLQGEQQFVEDKYHEIISATDAWLIPHDDEYEPYQNQGLQSTNSARRVCSLLEQITDRYSPLPRRDQQFRFLISVQLPVLNSYSGRIASSLDAYETLSSAFVRAVPGALSVSFGGKEDGGVHVDNRGLTTGIEGVQRLCKALLSAKYVEAVLRDWSEDLFFIQFWSEITHSIDLRTQANASPLLLNPSGSDENVPHDALFDRMVSQYELLVDRAQTMIIQQICVEVEALFKAHLSRVVQPDTEEDVVVSHTLLAPAALYSSHLSFLKSILPQNLLTVLYRRTASRLAEHILHRQILYRGSFDISQGKQILAECEIWIESCRVALGGGSMNGKLRIEAPWSKLFQAASLASAEGQIWIKISEAAFGKQITDEEWEVEITKIMGPMELTRNEVVKTLRRRADCTQ